MTACKDLRAWIYDLPVLKIYIYILLAFLKVILVFLFAKKTIDS